MLLAVDVGNTNITIGVFDGMDLVGTYRITTKTPRTSDEYGILLCSMLATKGISKEDIEDVIVASVVPGIMYSFHSGLHKYLGKTPMIVGIGTKTGIKVATGNAKDIGADRMVDLAAAYECFGGPVLVIDFGTATTYDLLTKDGSFIAGITSPGLRISANALWKDTAKLPEIEIEKPNSILAKDTVTSMQAGLVYGYIGQTEYIIKKVKEESGIADLLVVATGGLGKIIADSTDAINVYDPGLTLKGLLYIYLKNKNTGK